ncbi:MAG: hypothetical protein WCJ58_00890 [bacterium]
MKRDFCGNCGKVINGFVYGPWYDKSCGKCVRKALKEEEREERRLQKEKEKIEMQQLKKQKLKLEIKKLKQIKGE